MYKSHAGPAFKSRSFPSSLLYSLISYHRRANWHLGGNSCNYTVPQVRHLGRCVTQRGRRRRVGGRRGKRITTIQLWLTFLNWRPTFRKSTWSKRTWVGLNTDGLMLTANCWMLRSYNSEKYGIIEVLRTFWSSLICFVIVKDNWEKKKGGFSLICFVLNLYKNVS